MNLGKNQAAGLRAMLDSAEGRWPGAAWRMGSPAEGRRVMRSLARLGLVEEMPGGGWEVIPEPAREAIVHLKARSPYGEGMRDLVAVCIHCRRPIGRSSYKAHWRHRETRQRAC